MMLSGNSRRTRFLRVAIAVAPLYANLGMGKLAPEVPPARRVRAVRVEKARVTIEGRTAVEGARELRSLASYDLEGNLIETVQYDETAPPGGRRQTHAYGHDPMGQVTEDVCIGDHQLVMSRRAFTLDSRGRVVEERIYGGDGSLQERLTYLYDPAGLKTAEDYFAGDGPLTRRTEFSYDPEGRLSEVRVLAGTLGAMAGTYLDGEGANLKQSATPHTVLSRTAFTYPAEGGSPGECDIYGPAGQLLRTIIFQVGDGKSDVEETDYAPGGSVVSRELRRIDGQDKWGNATKSSKLKWNEKTASFEPYEVTYTTYTYCE